MAPEVKATSSRPQYCTTPPAPRLEPAPSPLLPLDATLEMLPPPIALDDSRPWCSTMTPLLLGLELLGSPKGSSKLTGFGEMREGARIREARRCSDWGSQP